MASRNFSDLWGGRSVFATNPFTEMQRDFNRLFGDAFRRGAPRIDVRESDDEVCVVADVPGVTPADLDLRIDGITLTLTAERHDESERARENYHVMERSVGLTRRSVQLPFAPDPEQVRANYENGVLTVHMPKSKQLQRGHRIEVQGSASGTPGGAAMSGNIGVGPQASDVSGMTPPTGAAGPSQRLTETEAPGKPAEGVA